MSSIRVEFTFHGHTCDGIIFCEDGITFVDLLDLGDDLIAHIEEEADLQ